MTKVEKEVVDYIKSLPVKSFRNQYGEKFNIHLHPIGVLMSGDEVDMMVEDKHKIAGKYLQLFTQAFSVWSHEELNELGKALQELTNE